jgi:hypothetical protein
MDENKRKHLEFIQGVITRMNSNSFLIKGWTITLVSALFALAAKDANINYVLVSYVAIPVFWILDGYYISQERQYRDLYNDVRTKKEDIIDFSMDTRKYNSGNSNWISGIFSKTILPFYGIFVGITLLVMYLLNKS